MPTEEEHRLLPQLVEARKKLFALRSKLDQTTDRSASDTQVELWRTVKAAEDECHRLRAALRSIRNPATLGELKLP
jgi:hypothetical protein